jgi:hypothetical protein
MHVLLHQGCNLQREKKYPKGIKREREKHLHFRVAISVACSNLARLAVASTTLVPNAVFLYPASETALKIMCACVFVRVHVCVCVCQHAYTYACINTSHTLTHTYTHTYTYTHTHTHKHIHTHLHISFCVFGNSRYAIPLETYLENAIVIKIFADTLF